MRVSRAPASFGWAGGETCNSWGAGAVPRPCLLRFTRARSFVTCAQMCVYLPRHLLANQVIVVAYDSHEDIDTPTDLDSSAY